LRISLSKLKGRKDLGPTVSMYSSDKNNIKVVQLLSKDKLTSHRQKFTYILGSNCNEVKSITYSLGSMMTEVTPEKCLNIEGNFSQMEKVYLYVSRICSSFFETEQNSNPPSVETNKSTKVIKE
jgi:hypothetical protein